MQNGEGNDVLVLKADAVDKDGNPNYKVCLSHNHRHILFENGEDRYLYTAVGKGKAKRFLGRRINHLSAKGSGCILHYSEDLICFGFYAICAREKDKKVRLLHSNRANF